MVDFLKKLRAFLSPAGSFSRVEFLIASAILTLVLIQSAELAGSHPGIISSEILLALLLIIYALWGVAVGKRSRDLGTTFTYGMVIGMIFPIMGLIFLFQPGKKSQSPKSTAPVGDNAA